MRDWRHRVRFYFSNRNFRHALFSSLLSLVFALVVNFYAGIYATEKASNPVTDIILNNLPLFNVDMIFLYGPFFLFAFLLYLLIVNPQKSPFVIKSISLFILIRAGFITLTHIGLFPTHLVIAPTNLIVRFFTPGADLFFSAHAGLPFLFALIFWFDRRLRAVFIAASLFFGAVVLMGHFHYSIDVLSAFFITYAIYHLAEFLFAKDKKVFDSEPAALSLD